MKEIKLTFTDKSAQAIRTYLSSQRGNEPLGDDLAPYIEWLLLKAVADKAQADADEAIRALSEEPTI